VRSSKLILKSVIGSIYFRDRMDSAKSIEKRILKYVITYGSTAEDDLVHFIAQESGCSFIKVKNALDKMAAKGKIGQVKHCKLKPPKVYVDLREHALLRLEGELFANIMETTERENMLDEAFKIREEAYAVAVTDDFRETNIEIERRVKKLQTAAKKVMTALYGAAAPLYFPPIINSNDLDERKNTTKI